MITETNTKTPSDPAVVLQRLVRQLTEDARDRKRRLRMRLDDLRGGWTRIAVRGPMLPNGRPSPQWVIYQNAINNHKHATVELAALLRVFPNAERSHGAKKPKA